MVTGGTGHDRCPSQVPGPIRRPDHCGGDWKIIKTGFGFKAADKIF
jgi:hypothetical protein